MGNKNPKQTKINHSKTIDINAKIVKKQPNLNTRTPGSHSHSSTVSSLHRNASEFDAFLDDIIGKLSIKRNSHSGSMRGNNNNSKHYMSDTDNESSVIDSNGIHIVNIDDVVDTKDHNKSKDRNENDKINKNKPKLRQLSSVVSQADLQEIKETTNEDIFDMVPKQNIINDIEEIYTYIEQLGTGVSCKVLLMKHKDTNKLYALKQMIRKDKYNPSCFRKEIKIFNILGKHNNILNYHNCYLTKKFFYIATEFCSGGNLLEKILQMKVFTEHIACQYIYTLTKTIEYCHKKNIVHRDLKPGNIMFSIKGNNGILKLIDFGDSEIVDDEKIYEEFVGTIHFLPPEVTRFRYGYELKKSDLWSLGVLTYMLLVGKPPFRGKDNKAILKKIKKGVYHIPSNANLSSNAKSFIKCLLNISIPKRFDASEALNHPWLMNSQKPSDTNETAISVGLLDNLKGLHEATHLQKLLVSRIVNELNDNDRQILINAFNDMDINQDGYLDENEIYLYLMKMDCFKHTPNKARAKAIELINTFDKKKSGKINLKQYVDAHTYLSINQKVLGHKVESISKSPLPIINHDVDSYNRMSVNEFKQMLIQQNKFEYDINEIMKEFDPNNTGYITLESIFQYKQKLKSVNTIGTQYSGSYM